MAWAWFNGLLTSRTRLLLKVTALSICLSCRRWSQTCAPFPAALTCTDTEGALQPVWIRHLAIIVNLEYDPTAAFRIRWCILISVSWMSSALARIKLSGRKRGPAVSQLVERSAYAHFNGEQSMIEALKTILGKMLRTPHRQIAWKSSATASICALNPYSRAATGF